MSKHTPGPWRYALDGDSNNDMRHAVLANVNDLWVAACYRSGTTAKHDSSPEADQEAEANARLIAAAPAMLEALENMTAIVRIGYPKSNSPLDKQIRAAEAAIKAAKGGA